MMIEFTQYLRPSGRPKQVWIDRPAGVAVSANVLREAGCRFEIEVLMTGEVSMTVERDDAESGTTVLGHEICANGPEVPKLVDKLISAARAALKAM